VCSGLKNKYLLCISSMFTNKLCLHHIIEISKTTRAIGEKLATCFHWNQINATIYKCDHLVETFEMIFPTGQNLSKFSTILCFGWIERGARRSSALMVEQGVLGVLRILCWVDPVDCGPRGVWRDVLICGGRVRIMSKHQVVGDGSSHRCCGRRCGLLLPLRLLILTPTLPEEQEAVAVPLNRVVGHVHVHLDLVAHPFPQIADSGHTAK
jgi:hypothetical protein